MDIVDTSFEDEDWSSLLIKTYPDYGKIEKS